ncbi:hypothetical protein V6M85_05935 [Sulfolobus tengchongensis]|uniref:Uncharacterized protein n=1 Tax=Sulfolobus tengchongensis TaxID=207809 RepID=A0AAX4L3D1_9CREN
MEKLLSEEEILKIVIENTEFNNGKIMANVELFEGATYYVLATHLVKKYRCNKPFSIDNLRDILSLMSSVCNRLSNQLIDELIISLNYLLKYLELKEKEYRLIDIYDLIKLPLNVFMRKEKIVSEILNSYRGDCDNIDLNGIGLDPNATVIKIDSDKVRIYYAEECEDKVLNRLKDLMGD